MARVSAHLSSLAMKEVVFDMVIKTPRCTLHDTYLGGDQPSSPAEGRKHMSKYMQWLSSLGDAAISPANPLIHNVSL